MTKPPYEITSAILGLFGEVQDRLGQCRGLLLNRPQARLRRENRIKSIHSSLAIEGNTLALEQVTALLDNKRVLAPANDILEVKNAIAAYDQLANLDSASAGDFLIAHQLLMKGLIDEAGNYRSGSVGIAKGDQIAHIAPPAARVPALMNNLFEYLRSDKDPLLIKSCVFHYEMEFIHPFLDGNGRLGRFWQTRILMDQSPIFEYLPIEASIRQTQSGYYRALEQADSEGQSTVVIEYLLGRILASLEELLAASPGRPDHSQRIAFALPLLDGWFDRKRYQQVCQGISSATASRDLKQMVSEGLVAVEGAGRMTRYCRVPQ